MRPCLSRPWSTQGGKGHGRNPQWRKALWQDLNLPWPRRPTSCAGWNEPETSHGLEANSAQSELLRLDIELFPFAPFGDRVWALRSNLTSYDAWYVALAEALDCPLVTLDRKLSRAPGPTCDIIVPSRQMTGES